MKQTIFNKRNLLVWLHFFTWAMIGSLVMGSLSSFMPPNYLYWKASISIFFIICTFYITSQYLVKNFFEKGNHRLFVPISILTLLLIIGVRYYVEEIYLGNFFSKFELEEARERLSLLSVGAWMRLSLSTLLTYSIGLLYCLAYAGVLRQQRENELLALQYRTELKQLIEQVNPHFLFNTIHNIYSLAVSKDEQTAPMLLKLSEVLRYSLYQSEKARVPLLQEIDTLNSVLAIYSLRHDPPLLSTILPPETAGEHLIPPLLLLPLIENMFKHGDSSMPEKWNIRLWLEGDKLHFYSQNPLRTKEKKEDEDNGLGLANVRKRLELIYGHQFEFLGWGEKDLFMVKLIIPLT